MHQIIPVAEQIVEHAYDGYMAIRGIENLIDNFDRSREAYNHEREFHSNARIDLDMTREVTGYNTLGITIDSFNDRLADQLMREHSNNDHVHADVHSNNDAHIAQDNSEVIDHDRVYDASLTTYDRNSATDTTSREIGQLHAATDNFRFSDLTSHDNRHAVSLDYEPHINNNSYRLRSDFSKNHIENLDVGVKIPEEKFLKTILSKSDSFEVVNAQVALALDSWSRGNSKFNIHSSAKSDIREFFFDRQGHFKAIESSERRSQLLHILAPSIKKYFEQIGAKEKYTEFLLENGIDGIGSAYYLRELEIDGKDIFDYVEDFSAGIHSFFHDFAHSSPNVSEFESGPFIKDLGILQQLCETKNFAEAKAYINKRIIQRISIDDDYARSHNLADHNCLCKLYDNYMTKERLNESATLSKSAIIESISKKNDSSLLNDKPNHSKEETGEAAQQKVVQQSIESEASSPIGPNLNDPQNDKEKKSDESNEKSLKETKTYKDAYAEIERSGEKFEKLGLKPISKKDLRHIVNGHTVEGAKTAGKTQFNANENFIELVLEGWEKGTWVDRNSKIYDTGRIIGHDAAGSPKSSIKIFLNGTGDSIRTVFPV